MTSHLKVDLGERFERYVALDIHKHYIMVGAVNLRRQWVLKPRKITMSRFRKWVHKNLRQGDAVVLESTSNAWDIFDLVDPLVSKIVVANPHKVGQIAQARVKTDKLAVEHLLTLLVANIVPEVWVPPHHVRDLRSLVSFRWRVNKQIGMSKNRLQSYIQRFNLTPPEGKLWAKKNAGWWDQQTFPDLVEFQIQHDLEILAHLEKRKAAIDQKLAELSNTEPWASDAVFLMQIPGFGVIFSMIVLSAIGDISRFPSPKKLAGYSGLCSGVHISGEKNQEKPITKAGRKELRWAMVEAAWGAVRSDPYWKAQYKRLKKKKHPNKAIVAIARRLLVGIWHILTKREPYHHADDETLAYKMLIWSQVMDDKARRGMTRRQFAKYGLLRLGTGQDIERIVRSGLPRRLAPAEEVLALKPELRPPR